MPTTIPIKDANGNTVYMVVNPGYDSADDMIKMKSVQKKWRDSFTGASLDATKWTNSVGAGGSISQSAGTLVMASGTTINSESWILSTEVFTIPFRVSIGLTLSQRIGNQTFYVEAVSVDPVTHNPNGLHALSWAFSGTVAAQAQYEVQNGGLARLPSGGIGISTTAGGSVFELEPYADEAWFHTGALDATTGRAQSYRRHQQIPDPNALYKIRLRWLNGASAPTSSTNATVQFLSVQDYAELTAEITAGRGNTVAGNALSVILAGAANASTDIGRVSVTGNPAVAGAVAHDGARGATAPVMTAARAISANYTAVATGDVADLIATLVGALVVKPFSIPEAEWSYAAALNGIVNTGTAVTIAAAAGAGLRRYITGIQLQSEALTNATEVAIRDGAGGTVLWRTKIGTGGLTLTNIQFPNPIRGTANTLLEVVTITASGAGAVYFNAQGYTAP